MPEHQWKKGISKEKIQKMRDFCWTRYQQTGRTDCDESYMVMCAPRFDGRPGPFIVI